MLRETNGSVETAHETHRLGLFARDTWLRLLTEAGFTPSPTTSCRPGTTTRGPGSWAGDQPTDVRGPLDPSPGAHFSVPAKVPLSL